MLKLEREFAPLFLPQNKGNRPHILNLLDDDNLREHLPYDQFNTVPIQTIGIRTDMKMKMFEWESNDFELAPHILSNLTTGITMQIRMTPAKWVPAARVSLLSMAASVNPTKTMGQLTSIVPLL